MDYKAYNRSNRDTADLEQMMKSFMPFAQKRIGFNRPPTINWASDDVNAKNALGKTGFYDPAEMSITVFVDNRHPKDILRSLSHELVHHGQNCRGDLNVAGAGEQGYAQKDPHLREMEREAYEVGNLCFRDWEDNYKQQTNYVQVSVSLSENKQLRSKTMGINDKLNNALNKSLMERWGYKITEDEDEEDPYRINKLQMDCDDGNQGACMELADMGILEEDEEPKEELEEGQHCPDEEKVDGKCPELEEGSASGRDDPRRPDPRKRPYPAESMIRKIVRETIKRKLNKNG